MYGLYIHIPFCESRCIYCGFYSTTQSKFIDRYLRAVCKEMELRKDYLPDRRIRTIYLGGGTPSLLSHRHLSTIFHNINKVYDTGCLQEVTLECNPDDVTADFASALRSLPVNRVSLGAQTFSDDRLRFLNRRHTSLEIVSAVSDLRRAGVNNISIDLMFGFPGQTLDEWHTDIDRALALEVEHISAYSLMYEEGTRLFKMLSLGKVQETDEEKSRSMYEILIDKLCSAGYEHYEISNFAKPGYRSCHNSSYWQAVPYIGIGAAAHSYDCRSRQWNIDNIELYMQGIEHGEIPMEKEILSPETVYNDTITTALRTYEGIDLNKQHPNFRNYFMKNAQKHITSGFLEINGDRARLTRKGLYVSDMVMSDLMFV